MSEHCFTSASGEFTSAGKVQNRENPGVESSSKEKCGAEWFGAEKKIETDKSFIDGGTGTYTEMDQFFLGIVRELLLGKRAEPERRIAGETKLKEGDVEVSTGARRLQLKS